MRSLPDCVPRRWWELRGPVAVWTPGGIWESWDADVAHHTELLALEVGDDAAGRLALSRRGDASCIGHAVYHRMPPTPERVGQLTLI